jgi:hypothetical protein
VVQWNLLGQTAASKCKNVPTFQRVTLSPSSGASSRYWQPGYETGLLSETSEHFYALTCLFAWEEFIEFCGRQSFKTYTFCGPDGPCKVVISLQGHIRKTYVFATLSDRIIPLQWAPVLNDYSTWQTNLTCKCGKTVLPAYSCDTVWFTKFHNLNTCLYVIKCYIDIRIWYGMSLYSMHRKRANGHLNHCQGICESRIPHTLLRV